MISKGFFRSSLIYSVVGALPYMTGFILIPWFTALLRPDQFGVNAMYIALMYLVQILASYGLDMSAGVLYFDYRDDRKKLRDFLGTVFLCILAIGIITTAFFSLGGLRLFNFVFDTSDFIGFMPFGLLTILSGVFNAVFKTYSSVLINQQRPVRFFWLNVANFILTIAASLLLLYYFPYTLYGPVLGRFIPAVLIALSAGIMAGAEYGLSWNREYAARLISYSSPILLYAFLTWIVSNADRFIIAGQLADTALVAVYDVAVKLVILLDLVMTGLINTINPKIYTIWKEKEIRTGTPEINRYYHAMTALFLLLIPAFVLVMPVVVPFFIRDPVYYQAFGFLAILAAGYTTRVWFYMFLAPLMFFKRTRALPRVFMVSAAFSVVTTLVLVRYFGLAGAVWSGFLVKPLQALLMYLECRKIYVFRVNPNKIFFTPVIYSMSVVLSEVFLPGPYRVYGHVGQFLLAVVLVFFTYRKEIMPFVGTFLPKGS